MVEMDCSEDRVNPAPFSAFSLLRRIRGPGMLALVCHPVAEIYDPLCLTR